ncbi:MAG: hypothetical protein C4321_07995 [Chloroflexota bacterium]
MRLQRDLLVLASVLFLDLFSTLVLVQWFGFHEANPVLAYYLHLDPAIFAAVKCFTFIPTLYLLEWYRKFNPRFVGRLARLGLGLYVTLYVVGVTFAHRHLF